jgi:hypothetical protein
MEYKTRVLHWTYNDGWKHIPRFLALPGGPDKEYDGSLVGWFCWVYPESNDEFTGWMDLNMVGQHDYTFRFNSGDPMFTVHIRDEEDAALFKLRWM